jgi:hypothetical protein
MSNQKIKHQFIEDTGDIALFATQIPLPVFINLFHQRFEKKSMLESKLEILQQFYFKWSQNHMNFPFILEIFPHTHYGVSDVASLLLLLV